MSSYTIKARNKQTGEVHTVWCIDDYFGRHQYGYSVLGRTGQEGDNALTEEEFEATYERVE